MPIKKFHSVEEMDPPHIHTAGTAALARALASLWDFGRRVAPRHHRPGVRKFRSIEEMNSTEVPRIISAGTPDREA